MKNNYSFKLKILKLYGLGTFVKHFQVKEQTLKDGSISTLPFLRKRKQKWRFNDRLVCCASLIFHTELHSYLFLNYLPPTACYYNKISVKTLCKQIHLFKVT